MPIYPNEILDYLLKTEQKKDNILKPIESRNIEFLFIDCRLENKEVCISKACHVPLNLENKTVN